MEGKQKAWMIHRLAKEYGTTPSQYLMGDKTTFTMDYAVYAVGKRMDASLEEQARKNAERTAHKANADPEHNAHLRPDYSGS